MVNKKYSLVKFLMFVVAILASFGAQAGFQVVYDPAQGIPSKYHLSIPIVATVKEKCATSHRVVKVKMTGNVEIDTLPVEGLTGTDASLGFDFHEYTGGARVTLYSKYREYTRVFYESAGAAIFAKKRRVYAYFSGRTEGYDKLSGGIYYDYPLRSRAKDATEDLFHSLQGSSKFAVAGVVAIPTYAPDTFHHLNGKLWLTSSDGQCTIVGKYKQK